MRAGVSERRSGDSLSECLRTLQAPVYLAWAWESGHWLPLLGHWWQMVTPGCWWPITAGDGWGLTNQGAGQPVCPDMCLAPLTLSSVRDKQPVTLETREQHNLSEKSVNIKAVSCHWAVSSAGMAFIRIFRTLGGKLFIKILVTRHYQISASAISQNIGLNRHKSNVQHFYFCLQWRI